MALRVGVRWKGKPVVLKTANRNIENAAQLLFTEYQINERVAKEVRGGARAGLLFRTCPQPDDDDDDHF